MASISTASIPSENPKFDSITSDDLKPDNLPINTNVNGHDDVSLNNGTDSSLEPVEESSALQKEKASIDNTQHENPNCNKKISELEELFDKLNITYSDCNFSIKDFYKYAIKFFKEKSGKAIHLSYEDNCYFIALSQQISYGRFNPATAKTLGVLDVVGRDRRLAWQSLGNITKDEAMQQFIQRLQKVTPTFIPYIEAVMADQMEKERLRKEKEELEKANEEEKLLQEDLKRKEEEESRKQEQTKRQIQEALNQQTFVQFKTYAEQQYPGNPEQQAILIKQLQQQHYQKYMQQVYQRQLLQYEQNIASAHENEEISATNAECEQTPQDTLLAENNGEEEEENDHSDDEGPDDACIAPASMWTRRDVSEFKASIRAEGGDSVIRIGYGETVTVRVPTHQAGACLFWEFATDAYDLGFGVLFEWHREGEESDSGGVTVHVTDTDSEDEDEDAPSSDDVEGAAAVAKDNSKKPPTSVVIPVYRRDCHEEVYAGSHAYPGTGVYLLKFDNSYSLWRNKVLYYRVYYTQR